MDPSVTTALPVESGMNVSTRPCLSPSVWPNWRNARLANLASKSVVKIRIWLSTLIKRRLQAKETGQLIVRWRS